MLFDDLAPKGGAPARQNAHGQGSVGTGGRDYVRKSVRGAHN